MSNSDSENRNKLNRRQALLISGAAGMGTLLAGTGTARASDDAKKAAHQESGSCSTPRSAVAKTQYGKVRGYLSGRRRLDEAETHAGHFHSQSGRTPAPGGEGIWF